MAGTDEQIEDFDVVPLSFCFGSQPIGLERCVLGCGFRLHIGQLTVPADGSLAVPDLRLL